MLREYETALWHGVCAEETLSNMFFDYVDSLILEITLTPMYIRAYLLIDSI
jgi:hypothetical protein